MDRMKRAAGGFTLIELMITVAIVAILAAVAYPSYTRHIAKGKRAAAQSFMMNVQAKEEQYMLNARSYFDIDNATAGKTWTDVKITVPDEVAQNYTVAVELVAGPPPGYKVVATPRGVQATNDPQCGTLTLTNAGAKTASGGGATCW